MTITGRNTTTVEIRRVSVNFTWPLNIPYKGFLNPFKNNVCIYCEGTGYNEVTKELHKTYFYAHSEKVFGGWGVKEVPRDDEVEILSGQLGMDFHKCKDRLIGDLGFIQETKDARVNIRAMRLMVHGWCHCCNGVKEVFCDERHRRLKEEWNPVPPEVGNYYQIWVKYDEEDQRPVTPAMASVDDLASWATENMGRFDDKSWKTQFRGLLKIADMKKAVENTQREESRA